ncbi:MAG: hypothetical protein ACKOWD_01195 [Rhodoferax sp.]
MTILLFDRERIFARTLPTALGVRTSSKQPSLSAHEFVPWHL